MSASSTPATWTLVSEWPGADQIRARAAGDPVVAQAADQDRRHLDGAAGLVDADGVVAGAAIDPDRPHPRGALGAHLDAVDRRPQDGVVRGVAVDHDRV